MIFEPRARCERRGKWERGGLSAILLWRLTMVPTEGHPKTVWAVVAAKPGDFLERKIRVYQEPLCVIQAQALQFITGMNTGVFEKRLQKTPPGERGNPGEIHHFDGAMPVSGEETQTAIDRRMANQMGLHAPNSKAGISVRPPDFRQTALEIRRSITPGDCAHRTSQAVRRRACFSRYCLGERPVPFLKANQKLLALW